ncbi:MAG: peptide ABC transporter substrate-binding protein [Lachnospiraceae bacterium]|nr:peptide ABC transporter substrate-binding protein [Lachnospiraceae bacterium]MBO7339284.1 peptide ABC transporter substrate-binding protein [Lachnospiraceae bacterium]MBP5263760.1 peptide ABC transporter substrate-binding protein [Lachnospiraceae bacterium]
MKINRFWKKGLALLLSATFALGTLAGCGTYESDGSNTSNAQGGGNTQQAAAGANIEGQSVDGGKIVRIAIASDPEFTFDAIGDSLMVTNGLLREGLTRYGDGVLVDGLAESYEHNEDYTQWTFHLRESGWSNGEPVTADDWVYAIGAMLDGTAQLSFADFLYEIKNAREVYTKQKDVSELGVKALDDKTLVFELAYPVTYFPYLITHPMHFGYDREFSEKVGVENIGTEAQYSISNGPFYVDSWEHDNLLIFKKNPYYWNKDNVKIDQVNVYVIPNQATQVNLFLNGELDVVDFAYQRQSAIEAAGFASQVYNNGRTAYLNYNEANQYLKNKHVRQAISSAIDRDAIVNGVLHVGSVADGLIPIGLAGDGKKTFREIVGNNLPYSYNVDKAKELLAQGLSELGLTSPSDISITILASNTDEFIAVSGAIQQLLQENLGIKAEVETTDSSALRTRRNAYEYDVVLQSWGADWDDATNFLGGYEHDASANPAVFINEEFNDTYHKATYSTDLTERIKLLGKAEAILLEEEGITPLYYTGQYYAVSNRLKGVLRRAVVPYLDLYFADVQ